MNYSSPGSLFNSLFKELIAKIAESYRRTKQVDEELLMSLNVLFPTQLVSALDLCDHNSFTLLSSPSGRKMYKCIGSSGTPYLILYPGYICSCPAYKFGRISKNRYCKHLIALQFNLAISNVAEKDVGESLIIQLISELMCEDL